MELHHLEYLRQGVRAGKFQPPSEHIHEWGEPKEGDNGEAVHWCKTCEATKDSDGGIID